MLPIDKLQTLARRFREAEYLLCAPETLSDPAMLQRLNKERSDLEAVVEAFNKLQELWKKLDEARELVNDPELAEARGRSSRSSSASNRRPRPGSRSYCYLKTHTTNATRFLRSAAGREAKRLRSLRAISFV